MSLKLVIKICCIMSREEALLAIRQGASAIGLVSEMPSGPGVISENEIAQIAAAVPKDIDTFLLTSKQNVESIITQHEKCKTTTLQLVDDLLVGAHADLKKELPDVKIVQVIHVVDNESVEKAIRVSKEVDALLLDSGNQSLDVKELGGTGRTHNWELSKQIVEQVKVPVYLAGGINRGNIKEAYEKVHPFGIDLCSGVRTNNKLDEEKLKQLFTAIN